MLNQVLANPKFKTRFLRTQNLKHKDMKTFNYRGTTINKVNILDIQIELEDKGFDFFKVWEQLSDGESDYVYISNGFLLGLKSEESDLHEWHHYFKKGEDGDFEAFKLNFNN